jgi:hypothetical protein
MLCISNASINRTICNAQLNIRITKEPLPQSLAAEFQQTAFFSLVEPFISGIMLVGSQGD